jgi:hypothetical protein
MIGFTRQLDDGTHEHVYQFRELGTEHPILQQSVACDHPSPGNHEPAQAFEVWQSMREEVERLGYTIGL